MRDFLTKIGFVRPFLIELAVYACFVSVYFLLVLHLMSDWIKQIYDTNRPLYAILAVVLIVVQAVALERLTRGLLWIIEHAQSIILVLKRLTRPHETVTRPKEAPGLLVYRFAGPLFFLNAAHFANRVQELIDEAQPSPTVFLVNAEAIVDMDVRASEMLVELHDDLKEQGIVLGICEAKGHFLEVLRDIRLTDGSAFNIYPSVAAATKEFKNEAAAKD